jgi:predicted alpha/beta-fold hydrolase
MHGVVVESDFRPAWWLPGAHAQTIGAQVRRAIPLPLEWEEFTLPDGDFLELGWTGPAEGPVVALIHGLGGSFESVHIRGLARAMAGAGWRVCLFHFRGCARRPNRSLTTYHNGMTSDLDAVFRALARRYPDRPRAAVGVSLGGNALLKLLGEQAEAVPLHGAAAISVALELRPCVDRLNTGFSRFYQGLLLRRLKRRLAQRRALISQHLDWGRIVSARRFPSFDDAFTAPVHGFADAEDYYARASSRPQLHRVQVPTLILVAADDPFLAPAALPQAADLSPAIRAEVSAGGGHVGFVAGPPHKPVYWLEPRIVRWLEGLAAG